MRSPRFIASASAGCVPLPLFYHDYAAGCSPEDEPHLELVYELKRAFDERFTDSLLACVLRELNPEVQLLAVDEPHDIIRRDWPWLADDDLDAVEARCAYYCGQAPAAHEAELQQCLLDLVPISESLIDYHAS